MKGVKVYKTHCLSRLEESNVDKHKDTVVTHIHSSNTHAHGNAYWKKICLKKKQKTQELNEELRTSHS